MEKAETEMREKIVKASNLMLSLHSQLQGNSQVFVIVGTKHSGKTTLQYLLCGDKLILERDENKKIDFLLPEQKWGDAFVDKDAVDVTSRSPNLRFVQGQTSKKAVLDFPDLSSLSEMEQLIWSDFMARVMQVFECHWIFVLTSINATETEDIKNEFECLRKLIDYEANSASQELLGDCLTVVLSNLKEGHDDAEEFKERIEEELEPEYPILGEMLMKIIEQDRLIEFYCKESSGNDAWKGFEERSIFKRCGDPVWQQLEVRNAVPENQERILKFLEQFYSSQPNQYFADFLEIVQYLIVREVKSEEEVREINEKWKLISSQFSTKEQLAELDSLSLTDQSKNGLITWLSSFQDGVFNPSKSSISCHAEWAKACLKLQTKHEEAANLLLSFFIYALDFMVYIPIEQQSASDNLEQNKPQLFKLQVIDSLSRQVGKMDLGKSPKRKRIRKEFTLENLKAEFLGAQPLENWQRLSRVAELPENSFKLKLLFELFEELYFFSESEGSLLSEVMDGIVRITKQYSKLIWSHLILLMFTPDFLKMRACLEGERVVQEICQIKESNGWEEFTQEFCSALVRFEQLELREELEKMYGGGTTQAVEEDSGQLTEELMREQWQNLVAKKCRVSTPLGSNSKFKSVLTQFWRGIVGETEELEKQNPNISRGLTMEQMALRYPLPKQPLTESVS